MNRRPGAALATALAAALLMPLAVAGCAAQRPPPPPQNISFHTTPRAAQPARVAVLPTALSPGVGRTAGAMTQGLSAALRQLSLHEVVGVDPAREDLLPKQALERNTVSPADLVHLRELLRVDAVLLSRVDQFDAYDPLSIGVTCHLVSCIDGEVLWSATAQMDGHRKDIQDDIRRWHHASAGEGAGSIAGWKIVLESPVEFTRYVADRLVATIPATK